MISSGGAFTVSGCAHPEWPRSGLASSSAGATELAVSIGETPAAPSYEMSPVG
jgi:hypothetical protein